MNRKIRIRHAHGSVTITIIQTTSITTYGDVAQLINDELIKGDGKEEDGIPPSKQVWKVGYPPCLHPQVSSTDEFTLLNDNMIHVSSSSSSSSSTSGGEQQQPTIYFKLDTKPIIESLKQDLPMMPSDGVMIRRVMKSDNSCLFSSICYVLNDNTSFVLSSDQLRTAVADAIEAQPELYTEAFLGQTPTNYIKFITNPQSWGGQIELSILSQIFEIEIVALDIVSNRLDVYGCNDSNNNSKSLFKQRIYVIYDGIHYDALAFTYDIGLSQDQDVTRFLPTDLGVLEKSKLLCQQQHNSKSFTDTGNFSLRCTVCNEGFVGSKQAEQHANNTGHKNFAEMS